MGDCSGCGKCASAQHNTDDRANRELVREYLHPKSKKKLTNEQWVECCKLADGHGDAKPVESERSECWSHFDDSSRSALVGVASYIRQQVRPLEGNREIFAHAERMIADAIITVENTIGTLGATENWTDKHTRLDIALQNARWKLKTALKELS